MHRRIGVELSKIGGRMARRPLVLIHGYSDTAKGFEKWLEIFKRRGYDPTQIQVSDYKSLTNELTIKDLGEGLDRALKTVAHLREGQEFDAVVHSTGGLVIRTWLVGHPDRRKRLKNLVMLAPANFGSPMAHKGRSTLGAIFKGGKDLGPDFLEAGDRILSELELGSSYTWDLAMKDLLGGEKFYDSGTGGPFAFVCIGNKDYGFLKKIITEPGTDGTVRWSGCNLNCRKIIVDLTESPTSAIRRDGTADPRDRIVIEPWVNDDMPLLIANKLNHGTIMSDPTDELIDMVDRALNVKETADWQAWCTESSRLTRAAIDAGTEKYQQFVIRMVDERGDPIPDYHLEFFCDKGKGKGLEEMEFVDDAHPFTEDTSYRCFHVNLSKRKPEELQRLVVRVIASSGTAFVGYHGVGSEHLITPDRKSHNKDGKWDAELDLTPVLKGDVVSNDATKRPVEFFHPFTTTLIEMKLNREPEPLSGIVDILKLLDVKFPE
jgi:pimeloyl-ACP methyl ester carboxylesterase